MKRNERIADLREQAMTGNVGQLRPHDVRWVAAKGPLGWVIRDTWTPGDFCMGYTKPRPRRSPILVNEIKN